MRDDDQFKQAGAALDYQVQELTRSNTQTIEVQKRLSRLKEKVEIKGQELD